MTKRALWASWFLVLCLGCGSGGGVATDAAVATDGISSDAPSPGDVTVYPEAFDSSVVLTNPGMGFADFHFGWWCNLPPVTFTPEECVSRVEDHWPENYPDAGTAYFRWSWRQLEPTRGEIDFAMIDTALQSANLMGETLGFRVMTIEPGAAGVPDWLLEAPYQIAGEYRDGTFWPDYRNETFVSEHARLVAALGARYDDHPALDHVDIGAVGCWGEWNTACIDGAGNLIEIYDPTSDQERDQIQVALEGLIDHYLEAFSTTPLVMLGKSYDRELEIMLHAIQGGAGWRVDCWGDWGYWGPGWSHHTHAYPDMLANATAAYPAFPEVWRQAPIQLEVCGTLEQWQELGWTAEAPDGELYKSFEWAREQHASVLNAKFGDIPAGYVSAIDALLVDNGYRFVIDSFNHQGTVAAGGQVRWISSWRNLGVAPHYLRRTLTYRLRGQSATRTFSSPEDTRQWLPGAFVIDDTFTLPEDLPAGNYQLEVALVDRAGVQPATQPLPPLQLAIAGRDSDGWYPLSQLTVE